MKAKIADIFTSIQGEGLYLGEKQLFVRFFGCNLNCRFCDTKLDCFFEYEPQELFKELKLYRRKYHSVSFTGGEPLLQKDFLKEILKLTHKDRLKNYLETNGTLADSLREVIDYVDIVAMDLKFPSSTGLQHLWEEHREFLKIASRKEVFLKAVICSDTKEDDLNEAIRLIREVDRSVVLVLQPNAYEAQAGLAQKLSDFKDTCRKKKVGACIIPQIHKMIGVK